MQHHKIYPFSFVLLVDSLHLICVTIVIRIYKFTIVSYCIMFCIFQSNMIADSKFECPSCGYSAEDKKEIRPVLSTFCKPGVR